MIWNGKFTQKLMGFEFPDSRKLMGLEFPDSSDSDDSMQVQDEDNSYQAFLDSVLTLCQVISAYLQMLYNMTVR